MGLVSLGANKKRVASESKLTGGKDPTFLNQTKINNMAEILNVSIDLNKIDKSKVQTKDKNGNPFKNGAKYYNLQIFVNDDIDQYGNNVGVCDTQTKEQREAKEKKVYLGNGKRVWSSQTTDHPKEERKQESKPTAKKEEDFIDDLPF